ncbi:MAG: AAA family ATPase [Desulfurella sp.]|uniref:AAA family ATPase n=1 Tax=Desulfurella sp. TaxID=1962857 RepID=UPI003CA07F28
MYLNYISIFNFRNYKEFYSTFKPDINIIQGENASGKTNLLDAIYFLLNSHSFISKKFLEKQKESLLKGNVIKDISYNITISLNKNKKSLINSKNRSLKDFKTLFPSIIFSIKDFTNFSEKKYTLSLLDKFSFVENPNIIINIINTLKQLKFKRYLFEKKDYNTIKIINKDINKNIQIIQENRKKSAQTINLYLNKQNILQKNIKIVYSPFLFDEKIEHLEIQTMHNIFTLYKDSINILLDENNIFSYSSVGEKKMVLFTLMSSLINHYNIYEKEPIIMIDDIESDISKKNLEKILDNISKLKNQIFITTLGNIKMINANILTLSEGT